MIYIYSIISFTHALNNINYNNKYLINYSLLPVEPTIMQNNAMCIN
jgi:hypothetical protein